MARMLPSRHPGERKLKRKKHLSGGMDGTVGYLSFLRIGRREGMDTAPSLDRQTAQAGDRLRNKTDWRHPGADRGRRHTARSARLGKGSDVSSAVRPIPRRIPIVLHRAGRQPQGGDKKLHRPYACAASLRKTSHRPPQAASAREAGKNLRGESYEPSFSECFSAECSSFLGRQLQPALEDPQVGRPSQGRMKRVRTNQPAAKARKVKRFDMVAPAFVASSKK